jgi:hypothetical protein
MFAARRKWRRKCFRTVQVFSVLSLIVSVLIWYWSYSEKELAYLSSSRRWVARACLIEGVVALSVFHRPTFSLPQGSSLPSKWELLSYSIPVGKPPILIRVNSKWRTGWAGLQVKSIRIDILGSFFFFLFGVLPVAFFIVFPLLHRCRAVDESELCDASFDECPTCGYNLTDNTSGRCPECGWQLTRRYQEHRSMTDKQSVA